MSRSDTVRHRVTPDERVELEELSAWVGEKTLSDTIRRGLELLKQQSGFDHRNDDLDATADEPGPPAFIPGTGLG